ncbi:MAG: hypothetical protein HY553_12090 [Elusimicrobia bacterium]|nr:hypothetical protein [Elusimicrobiota bacterium]
MRRRTGWLAILLMLGALAGLRSCRSARTPPAFSASEAAPGLPVVSPPDARPLDSARKAEPDTAMWLSEPAAEEATVAEFLGILARRGRTPATDRFLDAFAARPALTDALKELRRAGGDRAPASDLVRALVAQADFRELLAEFRDDPGFREAAAAAVRDRRVARALDGYASVSADGEVALAGLGEGGGVAGARHGPDARPGQGAHDVGPRLERFRRAIGERAARAYWPSAFAVMPPRERATLEEACERYGVCDVVGACRVAELWSSCVAACRSGGRCPAELLDDREPDTPIVVSE